MNILFASSEVVPFAKTGGLADVCSALPAELARLEQNPIVFLPAYRQAMGSGQRITFTGIHFEIPIGNKTVTGQLLKSSLPQSNVPVYLVQQESYFDREELYTKNGSDYNDNCARFIFFCRAVLESIRLLKLKVDVVHCNDWHTGLIPAYLKTEFHDKPEYKDIASLLTIHNLAHQGSFWHWDMQLTGIDWKYFNWREMESYGNLNLLKAGIVFCDSINTVSPTYAREIQSAPLGCGLEGVLKHRSDVLSGIINGVDYKLWNPETDTRLPTNYNAAKCKEEKAKCKLALQREMGLPESERTPLIGLIGRLADQKGWNLIAEVMQRWAKQEDAQWVNLGTGQPEYHDMLFQLATDYPNRVAAKLTFSDDLAHRIEAGADIFIMASHFEPCGLNQLYSLKYGAVPVVRETGGLADTITNATEKSIDSGTANGFTFKSYDAESLERAISRAVKMYHDDKKTWRKIIRTGMKQDWSWTKSAKEYIDLYKKTISRHRKGTP